MRCLEASLLLLLPAAMVSHGCGVEVPDEPSLRANVLVAEARPPPDIPDARVMRIGMFLEAPGDTVDVTLNWNLKPAKERLEFGERPRDFSQVPKEAIVEESLDPNQAHSKDRKGWKGPNPAGKSCFASDGADEKTGFG